jgi:cytochrome oxidase Cu insertion factor (SCO1/SenC/PrrC family)
MDHTAILYVIDPSRRVIAALPESSPTLSADLVRALAGLGD